MPDDDPKNYGNTTLDFMESQLKLVPELGCGSTIQQLCPRKRPLSIPFNADFDSL